MHWKLMEILDWSENKEGFTKGNYKRRYTLFCIIHKNTNVSTSRIVNSFS